MAKRKIDRPQHIPQESSAKKKPDRRTDDILGTRTARNAGLKIQLKKLSDDTGLKLQLDKLFKEPGVENVSPAILEEFLAKEIKDRIGDLGALLEDDDTGLKLSRKKPDAV